MRFRAAMIAMNGMMMNSGFMARLRNRSTGL
jgi:hypothetical protein